jgi:branched-subunit amino acid ABC-type transport system permease component
VLPAAAASLALAAAAAVPGIVGWLRQARRHGPQPLKSGALWSFPGLMLGAGIAIVGLNIVGPPPKGIAQSDLAGTNWWSQFFLALGAQAIVFGCVAAFLAWRSQGRLAKTRPEDSSKEAGATEPLK